MIGCYPCITQFDKVVEVRPNFLTQLYGDTPPEWYDTDIQKALMAKYRKRIIGLCDIDEWVELFGDKAYLVKPKFDELWEAYKIDLLDFSTSKARTSTVYEAEEMPDTPAPPWLINQPSEREAQDVDAKLTIINPISAGRYLKARQASIIDYAGSSGLSTKTNLDDVNWLRDNLTGFIDDFVRVFESFFVARY